MRLGILLLLSIITVFMMFVCPPPCSQVFPTARGLNQHQRRCAIAQSEEEAIVVDASTKYAEKRARKRQRREVEAFQPIDPPLPSEEPPAVEREFVRVKPILPEQYLLTTRRISIWIIGVAARIPLVLLHHHQIWYLNPRSVRLGGSLARNA